ncbi:MAG: hypothetical protein EP318_06170 [Rhodobacteraceae bacterium]|nr:MAG: hypothetical protein EP318_06170 [Paracoccaceae bacterium]
MCKRRPTDDERLLGADPRDAVVDAELAIWGIIDLMGENDRPIHRGGMEALLRLVHDKLDPAAKSLQHFQPRA